MIIIYCPCKDKIEANKIARHLLNNHLIACANIIQAESLYNWKGKSHKDKEAIMLLKTNKRNVLKTEELIKKLHSYELPAIIKINAKANKEFENWIKKETN